MAGWHLWPRHPSPHLCLAQTEQVERNYIKEKKAAVKEFEDKKVELKENLIAELEEKKKMIENEKLTMELTGGTEGSPGPGGCLVTPLPHTSMAGRGLASRLPDRVSCRLCLYISSFLAGPPGGCCNYTSQKKGLGLWPCEEGGFVLVRVS